MIDSSLDRWWYYGRGGQQSHWPARFVALMPFQRLLDSQEEEKKGKCLHLKGGRRNEMSDEEISQSEVVAAIF